MKFNSPHLLLPQIYQEIRDIVPACTQGDVPRFAERLLRKVESISALMDGDSNPLPADVTQVIFWALNLIMQEKEEILYLLDNERGVTIATMQDYIADRFKTYKMIASALGSAPKPRLPPPPPRLPPAHITAGSATTEEDKQSRGRGRGQGGGFRGKGRGGGGTGPPQPSAGRGKDGRVGRAALSCEYCLAKKRPPILTILPNALG